MNNTLLKKVVITLAIIMTSFTSEAAKKVYNGQVLLTTNEIIIGKIEMLSPTLNEVRVKIITKEGKRIYKAKEVLEYSFEVEKWNHKTRQHYSTTITYVKKEVGRSPIPFGPTNVLLECQEKGIINMYNHFIEQHTDVENPYRHIIYVEKKQDELIAITPLNYKEVLKKLMIEYSDLQDKIGDQSYRFKDITKIIATYNIWMDENSEEVVMVK